MSDFLDLMRAYPDLLQASGVLGSVIYVGGFALVQSGRTCGNGSAYSASKIVAAVLVLVSLVGAFNLGAFLIQIGFIGFGLWGLLRQSASKARVISVTPPADYAPSAPDIRGDSPETCGWESHRRVPAGDTPVPPYPAAAVPAP